MRLMHEILKPHKKYADAYIDDVIIFTKLWKEHLQNLDAVLADIKKAGMTLRLSKCRFAKNRTKYLGHEVGGGYRSPMVDKVQAIKDIEEPKTKKLLKSFLGMTGFFRQYLKNYAEIALPLTELTKKEIFKQHQI